MTTGQVTLEEAAAPVVRVAPPAIPTPSADSEPSKKEGGLRKDWRCARRCGIVIPKGTDPLTLDYLPHGGWAHLQRCPTQQSIEEAARAAGETLSPQPAPQAAPEQPEQPEEQPETRVRAYVRARVQKVDLNPHFFGMGWIRFTLEPVEGFEAALHAERVPKRGRFGQEKYLATEDDAKAIAEARGWEMP